MNLPEPEMSLIAEIDQAVHDNEHTDRPDWCLDGAVPPTVMSTEHGSLAVHHDSCRYCLTDQAAAIGLGAALAGYLNTPPPPPRPPGPALSRMLTEAELAAARDVRRHLVAEQEAAEEEYRAGLEPAARAVYDLLNADVFAYHHYEDEAANELVHALVSAVRLADMETSRGAMAPERPDEGTGIVDVPLFTVEGDAPDTIREDAP